MRQSIQFKLNEKKKIKIQSLIDIEEEIHDSMAHCTLHQIQLQY